MATASDTGVLDDCPPAMAGPPAAEPVGEETLILVVDDDRGNVDALAALLTRPGVRLLKALDAREALELLLAHEIALALIDVRMPEIDGFELAELMRGSERCRRVPIIFVTAAAPESTRIFRGYEAGAVDFLFKPIEPRLLRSKVDVFIELYHQRRQLAAQVEEHSRLLHTAEMMLGVLGHDLRAPLSAITAAGEVLALACPDDEKVRGIASRIRSSSGRMTRLIEQLLDFATARHGGLPIRPQPTDLAELCQAGMGEFEEARMPLALEVTGDTGGTWDPDRLLQLVSNLLGNAMQHGDPASPVLLRIDGAEDAAVRIEVENGGAIPESIRPNLFSPFVHAGNGSCGLGLYIVDQIVRAHGGQVAVESAAARTVFSVRLPRHHCEERGETDAGEGPAS